jgi:hypothetical protein
LEQRFLSGADCGWTAIEKSQALYRRRNGNGVYWFRKATPLDLVNIIGRTDVRCSLRTTRRDVAKRRACQLLVALEHVYEVLRSEEPLEPAKILLGNFVQDFANNGAGTPEGFQLRLSSHGALPTFSEHLPRPFSTRRMQRGSASMTSSHCLPGNDHVPKQTRRQQIS